MVGPARYLVPVLIAAAAVLLLTPGGLPSVTAHGSSTELSATAPREAMVESPADSAPLTPTPTVSFSGELRSLPGEVAVPVPGGAGETSSASLAPLRGQASYPLVQGVVGSISHGRLPASAAYLPSLELLERPIGIPASVISPTYSSSPAPMGVADLGLSSSGAYVVTSPDVQGVVDLTGYNATAGSLYEDTGATYWNGLQPNTNLTPWQSGLQLNTVVTNVSYPGSDSGVFWTQNVLDFSGSTLQFVDNVWNFSGSSGALLPGTLASYNGTYVPDEFYFDEGPTLPLSFPLTIQLYNNASEIDGRAAVSFGYRITEGPTVYTRVYDTVVFNSQPTPSDPLLPPVYKVDGKSLNPFGLLYDNELVFTGPGGGSNAVVSAANGSLALRYGSGGVWSAPRATYDYGSDTGETSIGVAATWSGTTEQVSQGPSLLYGLWNTTRGVPSGRDLFTAQLTPDYGFAFLGPAGGSVTNLSWAPTSSTGTVTAWLPPNVPPATSYDVTAFADGYSQANLSFDFASPPAFPLALDLAGQPGTWNAPVYLDGESQAATFISDALGAPGPNLTLSGLTVHVNLTFNRLNDFGFPEFDLVWLSQVTSPVVIDDVRQGADSPSGQTLYATDSSQTPYVDDPNVGSQLALWQTPGARLANLTLYGVDSYTGVPLGGAVALWESPFVQGSSLTLYDDSFGLWAVQSANVSLSNSSASTGAVALSTLNSANASASDLSSVYGGTDVLDEGGTGGRFVGLNASSNGSGLLGLSANRSQLSGVTGEFALDLIELTNSSNDTVENVNANGSFVGLDAINTSYTSIDGLQLNDTVAGAGFVDASNDHAADLRTTGGDLGVELAHCAACSVTNVNSTATSVAVGLLFDNDSSVANVSATESGGPSGVVPWTITTGAVVSYDTNRSSISNVTAVGCDVGMYDLGSAALVVTELDADHDGFGAWLNATQNSTLNASAFSDDLLGLELSGHASGNLVASSAFDGSAGYGVSIVSGLLNVVSNNSFSNNNGLTTIYEPGRSQAFSVAGNEFDNATGVGNRWSDWHSYDGPHLAPYWISTTNNVADQDPIGPPAYPATFTETGLPSADAWGIGIAGTSQSTGPGATQLTLWMPNGSWTYVVEAPRDEVVADGGAVGTLTVAGSGPQVGVSFVAGRTASLTVTEAGLSRGTEWCLYLGPTDCSSARTLVIENLAPASYRYVVLPVPGYGAAASQGSRSLPLSGELTVGARGTRIHLMFSPTTYPVTVEAQGLPSGTAWHLKLTCLDPGGGSCSSGSVQRTVHTESTTFDLTNGSYRWQVRPIRGYELVFNGAVTWSGTLTVGGAGGTLVLTFYPEY